MDKLWKQLIEYLVQLSDFLKSKGFTLADIKAENATNAAILNWEDTPEVRIIDPGSVRPETKKEFFNTYLPLAGYCQLYLDIFPIESTKDGLVQFTKSASMDDLDSGLNVEFASILAMLIGAALGHSICFARKTEMQIMEPQGDLREIHTILMDIKGLTSTRIFNTCRVHWHWCAFAQHALGCFVADIKTVQRKMITRAENKAEKATNATAAQKHVEKTTKGARYKRFNEMLEMACECTHLISIILRDYGRIKGYFDAYLKYEKNYPEAFYDGRTDAQNCYHP